VLVAVVVAHQETLERTAELEALAEGEMAVD
jgi:hypothetical protein